MSKFWQIGISRTNLLTIILILVPQISVFFLLRTFFLEQILINAGLDQRGTLFCQGIYLASLAISAIIGSSISQKVDRRIFFLMTLSYRVLSSASILVFQNAVIPCFLLGSSFGLGFPSDQAFLADNTEAEVRGRVSGIIFCLTFVLVLIVLAGPGYDFSITQNTIMIIALQLLSTGALLINSSWESPTRIPMSLGIVRKNSAFVQYLLPWSMFSFVNGAVLFLWDMAPTTTVTALAVLVKYIGSIIFFIIAGIMADRYGRKITLLIGYVMLGLTYFLFPTIDNPIMDITISLFSGIAWSFILVSFLFTIVGDLSQEGSREFYFAISGLIWMVIETGFAFVSSIVTPVIPLSTLSSILSLVMFLSVIPLLTLQETLPRSKIRDRRISNYFERVLKTIEENDG